MIKHGQNADDAYEKDLPALVWQQNVEGRQKQKATEIDLCQVFQLREKQRKFL